MRFKLDKKIAISWGYYTCEHCKKKFYDLNHPLHEQDCIIKNNDPINNEEYVYWFGLREVKEVMESRDGRSKCGRLTLEVLTKDFSELLRERV